jgi:hypothetical protein
MVIYIRFVIPVKSALPSVMDWKSKIAWYPFAREPEYRLLFSLPRYSLLKSFAINGLPDLIKFPFWQKKAGGRLRQD